MTKQIHICILGASFAVLSLAGFASASSVNLSPTTVSVKEGQTFTVTVSVNPEGAKAYGVQFEATYPADTLEATGMTVASGWLSPADPSITAGKVSAMAGVGGGFEAAKTLGTIAFKAKKAGAATIVVGGGTNVANAQGTNTVSSRGAVTVSVVSAAPVVTETPKTETSVAESPKPVPKATRKTEPKMEEVATTSVEATTTAEATTTPIEAALSGIEGEGQTAAVGFLGTLANYWWAILLIVVVGGGIAWYSRKA